jgi:peptidyl-prolyl cis-trans isomerase D
MPIMTRMRESMPVILFGLLIAFLITIIFEWGMDYLGMRGGHSNTVGEIEGKSVTYQEFNELVKNVAENQKQQTGSEPDENTYKQIRDQVWDQLVTQRLVEKEIARLGLKVTDQELSDWFRGDNPPDEVKRMFADSSGFRSDIYGQFVANPVQFMQSQVERGMNLGGLTAAQWVANFETSVRQRRLSEKLQSILTSSVRVNEGEMRRRFMDQNVKYNANFVLLDPNTFVKDEEVTVTDADIKDFYQENIDQYKVEATRTVKFVTFLENPSSQDSADALKSIQDDYKAAVGGADFISLIATRSDKPDSGTWFKHGELTPPTETAVFSSKVGDLVGPITEFDGYHLMKIFDERKGASEFMRAAHILFQANGPDSNAVKATAADVARRAKAGEDFAKLASTYSKDPSNAQKGGDLGWFGKGRMVKEFEDACMKAKVGEVIGPVRTAFGIHVIKLMGKDSRELKVGRIISKIAASPQTRSDVQQRAQDFSAIAKASEFAKEAGAISLTPREATVQEKGGVIPGLGVNQSATKWAFKNKVGSVSEPYSIQNGWAVFTITDAKDAGVRPFEELKESLKPQVQRKKKTDKAKELASQFKAKLAAGDSLTKLVSVDPRLQLQRTGEFVMSAGAAGVGRDLNFFGALEAMNPGQISNPVVTPRGVYFIQMVSKTTFDSTAFNAQRETLRSQMLQEKRGRYVGEWLAKLKESATIEDNRDTFFR